MTRRPITSGSFIENETSSFRTIVKDNWVFVSGTAESDHPEIPAPSVAYQMEQCIKRISVALERAVSCLDDVVQVRCALPGVPEFEECWPVLRKYFGEGRSAGMMLSLGLADSSMPIAIEVSALKRATE